MRRHSIQRRRRRRGARAGFTLVEIIVAIVILVVGVLGLASTAAVVSRLIGGAAQQSIAANVAQSRFEVLRSTPCAAMAGGSASHRGVAEQWTVEPVGPRMFVADVTVRYSTPQGTRQPQTYRSHVQCRQ